MAIVKNDSLSSWAQFISWMQDNLVPNFFQSVAVDSEDSTLLVCTGVGGQKILGIVMAEGFYPSKYIIYRSDGTIVEETCATSSVVFQYVAVCANGAMIRFSRYADNISSSNGMTAFLITKNNHEKTAVIATHYTSQSSDQYASLKFTTNVRCFAEDDNPNIVPLSFHSRVMEQTQKVQFATNAASNEVSYTPDAFYLQCGNIYDIPYNRFTDDGVTYLTNGYWAVRDE